MEMFDGSKKLSMKRQKSRKVAGVVKKYCDEIKMENMLRRLSNEEIISQKTNPSICIEFPETENFKDSSQISDSSPIFSPASHPDTECSDDISLDFQSFQMPSTSNFNVSDSFVENSTANFEKSSSYSSESEISCSSSNLNSIEPISLEENLRQWALKHQISHSATTDLLKILKPCHPNLPVDSRFLLKTPKTIQNVYNLKNGEYAHFGIKKGLTLALKEEPLILSASLTLDINVDGLPLFRSSSTDFWPILGRLKENRTIFIIGIFCGTGKPSPLSDFLVHFVCEMKDLLENGFLYLDNLFTVQIGAFICDAPARAYLKCIKSHTGFSGCEKCTVEGERFKDRTIFTKLGKERTDKSFLMKTDEDHHKGDSPLLALPVGLVSQFPLDYMHLICLGVTKKLLTHWFHGKLTTRLPAKKCDEISESLVNIRKYIPTEFNRKPRSLKEFKRWKATEFRLFLLYTGPVVLKGKIPLAVYQNILLLHSATFILINPKPDLVLAKNLLEVFVEHSMKLYGKEFVSYNVHNLLHIVDDVKKYESLDNFSCFVFENYLGKIKRMLRTSYKLLQQICNRYSELANFTESSRKVVAFDEQMGYNFGNKIKELKFTAFKLNSDTGNNCCLLKNGAIVVVQYFLHKNGDKLLFYHEFVKKKEFYNYPCLSTDLDIFAVSSLSKELKFCNIKDIQCKCILLPCDTQHVCFPLKNLE